MYFTAFDITRGKVKKLIININRISNITENKYIIFLNCCKDDCFKRVIMVNKDALSKNTHVALTTWH